MFARWRFRVLIVTERTAAKFIPRCTQISRSKITQLLRFDLICETRTDPACYNYDLVSICKIAAHWHALLSFPGVI